jgi:hypothetical protein
MKTWATMRRITPKFSQLGTRVKVKPELWRIANRDLEYASKVMLLITLEHGKVFHILLASRQVIVSKTTGNKPAS